MRPPQTKSAIRITTHQQDYSREKLSFFIQNTGWNNGRYWGVAWVQMKSVQFVQHANRPATTGAGYPFHDRKSGNTRIETTNPGQRVAMRNVPMRPPPRDHQGFIGPSQITR